MCFLRLWPRPITHINWSCLRSLEFLPLGFTFPLLLASSGRFLLHLTLPLHPLQPSLTLCHFRRPMSCGMVCSGRVALLPGIRSECGFSGSWMKKKGSFDTGFTSHSVRPPSSFKVAASNSHRTLANCTQKQLRPPLPPENSKMCETRYSCIRCR